MAIAECKVNGNVELDLTTSKHILKECIPLVEGKGLEGDLSIFAFVQIKFSLILFQLCKVATKISKIGVLSWFLRFEELDSDFAL